MKNGIEIGDYVSFHDGDIGKVIGIEDHDRYYADLQIAYIDRESGEICQTKARADTVKVMIGKSYCPITMFERLESFVPVPMSPVQIEPEDYPGQRREIAVSEAISLIVNNADRAIMDASDGSREETDYITFRVAEAFFAKIGMHVVSGWQAKQMGLPAVQCGTKAVTTDGNTGGKKPLRDESHFND